MLNWIIRNKTVLTLTLCIVQSAGAIRIHLLQRSKTPPNECPGYDSKQSDGEVPVMHGEYGAPLHCHFSQVLFGPAW